MNILEILDEVERAYPESIFPELTDEELDAIHKERPGFIDRASAGMGRHLAKVIREKVKADMAWRERYEKRLIELGYMRQDAHESADAADNPDNEDPEDAAYEEYLDAMCE